MTATQFGRMATPDQVIACLAQGATLHQAEQRTRWPADAVRRLAAAKGGRVQPDGTVEGLPVTSAPKPGRPERCDDEAVGTGRGYRRHLARGELSCVACLGGVREEKAAAKARRAAREQAEAVTG